VKICTDFSAVVHRAGFGYALWAITQCIWLCTMGRGAGLVMRYGPQRQISYQSIEVQNSFQKLANSFNGTVMLKSACM
jgi:hypothetical protein